MFTADQSLLHGLLWEPQERAAALLLYVPGFGGSFCSPQDMGSFVAPLLEGGYALLAMNLRVVAPPGLAHSRFEDCVADLDAAIALARARGFERIVLLGDSLGGPRACYFWHERRPAAVAALVLMASIPSPYEEAQQRWNAADKARFEAHLQRARETIAAGRPQEVLFFPDFQPGRPLAVSAFTCINTFGTPAESKASTVKYLPEVTVPVLILHGRRDAISRPENARQMYDCAQQAAQRDLLWVDANHFFVVPPDALAYAQPLRQWLDEAVGAPG